MSKNKFIMYFFNGFYIYVYIYVFSVIYIGCLGFCNYALVVIKFIVSVRNIIFGNIYYVLMGLKVGVRSVEWR